MEDVWFGESYLMQVRSLLPIISHAFCILFPDLTLDAKMNFDDNAEFRQKELFARRDLTQQDEKEVEALKYNLNYIALDGE